MKNTPINKIVLTGLLTALCAVLGLTPLGMIPVGPLVATLLHIPVIIAALLVGMVPGMVVSLAFIITSIFSVPFAPTNAVQFIAVACTLILPRLAIAPVAVGIRHAFRRLSPAYSDAMSALGATMINTLGFMLFIWLFREPWAALFSSDINGFLAIFFFPAPFNGAAECVIAAIAVPAICAALRKAKLAPEPKR